MRKLLIGLLLCTTMFAALISPNISYLYMAFNMGSNNYRWEARIHWTGNFPNGAYGQEWIGPMAINAVGSPNTIYVGNFGGGSYDSMTASILLGTPTKTDILIRVQRDVAGTYNSGTPCYEVELSQVQGGYSAYTTMPIIVNTSASTLTFWARSGTIADWVRMYSTTVVPGTSGNNLVNPISVAYNPTNIVEDWEFNGNANDQNGVNPWVASSGSNTFTSSPSYSIGFPLVY